MNEQEDLLIVAKVGNVWRYTLNPLTRRRHANTDWIAGPVTEWCEAPTDGVLDQAREEASHIPDTKVARGDHLGRHERQASCHALGLCKRTAPHWTEDPRTFK